MTAPGQDDPDPSDQGSRAANQGKTEPFPPGAADEEPGETTGPDDERHERDMDEAHPQGPGTP